MGCRWELLLVGDLAHRLRGAGEEALAEVTALDAQLSPFRPGSEVAGLNRRAAARPVPVEPALFELLTRCRDLHAATGGAFDPTVGPLLALWGFRGGEARVPTDAELAEVLAAVGMDRVALDPAARSVRFTAPGMRLDLGAAGKGYAADEAVALLRRVGIDRALLHGGTSTIAAVGAPPGEPGWRVAIRDPRDGATLAEVLLRDEALGVSAVAGREVEIDGRRYGHLLDPRTGRPLEGPLLAAVRHPSALVADAWSTALMVGGEELLGRLEEGEALVVYADRIDTTPDWA